MKNVSRTSVSVVIPCYNGASFIVEALQSISDQTHQPLEVIVVDDGSTDNSADLAEKFGEPVRVLRQENQGESVARNRGISEAKGDWIALLDADDTWNPTKLSRQLEVASSQPDCVCIFTNYFFFGKGIEYKEMNDLPRHDAQADYRVRMLVEWSSISTSSVLVKTSIARKVRFPEDTGDSEDMIFFAMLRDFGSFARIDEPLTGYRRGPNQQTACQSFSLRSVLSRYQWYLNNTSRYSQVEGQAITANLLTELGRIHDLAYWHRERDLVQQCRMACDDIFDARPKMDQLFEKKMYPGWVYRFKDLLDAMLNSTPKSPAS